MSTSSTESGGSLPPTLDNDLVKPVSELVKRAKPATARKSGESAAPLIIAVYRYGDPYHKRRVKVPAHISWSEFLSLLSSRLEVGRDQQISTYDENGIEIVSVEDLVPNDVLVIKERSSSDYSRSPGVYPRGKQSEERGQLLPRHHEQAPPHLNSVSMETHRRVQAPPTPPTGTPLLTHFIKANHFGYYFLAEVDGQRIGGGREGGGEEGGGRKRIHCVVKVPTCDKSSDTSRIFEMESSLLRKVSGHRSIIIPPAVHILNFANEFLQLFFSHLPEHKQPPLTELFFSGTCSEAYLYPLFGVTMATKIKSGLTPERTIRYAYQLADTMNYLQQRGVIHQTLLPENIQVMSNDRVMVCNFETAVQTDPSTCTLIISHSLVAPSNRMGLSPEVLNTFSRGDAEVVDYSTQYLWSFGTLSVLMATGQHPLRNYPGRYLNEGYVKYRSHNYQCLPDINKYPSVFCRLVKRSLSCDPVRRPTLFQIISVMKKDPRTCSMMSSNGRGKNGAGSSVGVGSKSVHRRDSTRDHSELERSGEQGVGGVCVQSRRKHHSLTAAQPPPPLPPRNAPSLSPHEQTVPSKRTKTEPQPTHFGDGFSSNHLPSPRLREPHHWSHDNHTISAHDAHLSRDSQVRSHDSPGHTPSQQFCQSYEGDRPAAPQLPPAGVEQGRYSDVGTNTHRHSPHAPRATFERGAARPPPTLSPISQQRRGSLGGFSDDFSPQAQNFPPSSPAPRTSSDVTQSQSSARYSEAVHSPRVQRTSRKRSSGTSDSEGNGALTGGTEYQRLLPEESQDEHLTNQTETETQRPSNQPASFGATETYRMPRPGSAQDVRQVPRRPQLKIRSYEASRRLLRRPSEQVEFRRAASLQQSSGSSTVSSLPSRQCYSDSETRPSLYSSPLLPRAQQSHSHSPMMGLRNVPPWNSFARNTTGRDLPGNQIGGGDREEGVNGSLHRTEAAEGEREGVATEPMQVSPVATHVFEISDKLSDVSTSAQVGMTTGETATGEGDLVHPAPENVAMNPVEHSLTGQQWGEEGSGHQQQMECEPQTRESFGQSDSNHPEDSRHLHQQFTTEAARPELEGEPANQPSSISAQWAREQPSTPAELGQSQVHVPRNPAHATVYSGPHIMSPIAEASQEFSTQQTATQPFSASQTQHTQFTQSMHSLSPLPEQTNEAELRRSSSPFHHNALGNSVSAVLSPPSVASDNTNTSVTSQVARVVGRAEVPQLEPPSTSSDTSHSLTRSSEVDSSHQPHLHVQTSTGEDPAINFSTFSRQERAALTTPTNAAISSQFVPQVVPETVGNTPGRHSQSQMVPTQEPSGAGFTPATAAAQSQRTTSDVPDHHHLLQRSTPPSREDSQGRSLQSSGAFQSSVSDSGRERLAGGRQSWTTASAPPNGNWHRRSRQSASPTHSSSVLSDSVAVQFRVGRRHSHSNQPASEQGETGNHRGSDRRRHHRGSLGSPSGGVSRPHNHRTSQRLSQDLEMMTRAIEGMDSVTPPEGDGGVAREERPLPQAPSPPQAVPQAGRGGRLSSGNYGNGGAPTSRLSLNPDARLAYRALSSALSPPGQPSSGSGRTGTPHAHTDFLFRHSPNPPNSLTGLSQIPPNNDSPDLTRSDCNTQNLAQSGTPLTQGNIVPLSPVQLPGAIQVESQQSEVGIPPPAPGAGSSEYLPPYSPPRQDEPASQRTNSAVAREDLPLYRDPPPSYEEIFGQHGARRQRQRQRRPSRQSRRREEEGVTQGGESQSQQDPPTTHRHTRSSGHRKLPSLTSLFKRNRRHTTHDQQTSPSTTHHPSRPNPPEPSPHLASNSPHRTEAPAERQHHRATVSPEPSTLERTASWVAAYSQTPRPITAYQQLERGFREFSGRDEVSSSVSAGGNTPHLTGHSHVSRAVSDTATVTMRPAALSLTSHSQPTHHVHQLPPFTSSPGLPSYRHPPPFSHPLDPYLPQRETSYALNPQDSPAQHSRQPAQGPSQPDSSPRQSGYAPNPQESRGRGHTQEPSPQSVRVPNSHSNSQSQDSSSQPLSRPAPASPGTAQSPSHVSSHSLARAHGNSVNLSQPNISLSSAAHRDPSTSSVPPQQQTPLYHRILAHPPRTRPISPLVTSAEYGRSSLTSVTSPANASTSDSRALLASAVARISAERSTESLRASSSRSQQEIGSNSIEQIPPRQLFLPWQLDAQRTNEGDALRSNGNANNDKPSPKSSQNSPNATPKSSPMLSRRIATAVTGEREPSQPQQSQDRATENRASQDGNGTGSSGTGSGASRGGGGGEGEGKQSRRSTQRSRAASRRLAQQLSSSEEEEMTERSPSSGSQGRTRHRRKHGNSRSRSSSRQENKRGSFANPQAPEFFPSFQSQPIELPQDCLFSTVSSDLTAQSTVTSVVSRDSHMILQQPSHGHMTTEQSSHDQRQREMVLSQVQDDTSAKPQQERGSHDNSVETAEVSHDQPIMSPATRSHERVSTPEPPNEEAPPVQPEGGSHDRSHDPASDVTAVGVQVSSIGTAGTVARETVSPVTSTQSVTERTNLLHSPQLSTTSTTSKLCGHVCVAAGERERCCQCQQSPELPQSCQLCESRRSLEQVCSCAPNKPNKSCPMHRGRRQRALPTPIDAHRPSHQHNRKHLKNCIVM